jgi:hypothetical protein
VKVRMMVERLACGLHRKDSCEFTLVNAEYLRQRSPSSAKEDGIEFAVVLKEGSQAFGDGEDGVAMGGVLDDFVVDMLCKLHRSFRTAGWAYPPAFAGEGDKERVLAAVAIRPSSAVSEDSAVKIFVEGL